MPDDAIQHVVVLALENHSFDQMLGGLKSEFPELEGVTPEKPNKNVDSDGTVYTQAPTQERQMPFDPHHEVIHVAEQLEDNNGGFVRNFSRNYPGSKAEDRQFVMGYYPAGFLPGLHQLARNFTICDHWFSALPGPTWPNRFMALSGTAKGRTNMPDDGTHKNDLPGFFQQDQDTIFDRLNEKGIYWKSYFHDIPQSWVLSHQRSPHNAARYFYIGDFFADANGSERGFPQFCFIEPDFLGIVGNDDHPPHDIMKAQKLIADVYNALRSNEELWRTTLLVVFYDEHGGFYDHVVPPKAVPPDDFHAEYAFNQLGIRVPAVLVSPWVGRRIEKTQFDHTSLLKYVTEKFQLRPLPSRRIAEATSIGVAIQNQARADTLPRIELTREELTPPELDLEEQAIANTSAHDSGLKRLRDYLSIEIDEEAPRFYAAMARMLEGVRRVLERLKNWLQPVLGHGDFDVSIARPDKLGTADVSVQDDVARSLMRRKKAAVAILGDRIRDVKRPDYERRHAARTLELISGRRLHHSNKLDEADELLKMHGA